MTEVIFWLSLVATFYAYIGYPLLLYIWVKFFLPSNPEYNIHTFEHSISLILPVFNEEKILEEKIKNCLSLNYPEEKLEIIIISDGSTDSSNEIARKYADNYEKIQFIELSSRSGKARALNEGVKSAKNEIIVFSDASIILTEDSLKHIVSKFQDSSIGCISGEDHIYGNEGEGLYGKYELFLRNQESKIHSIVGASGSFYAQRRTICSPFEEGMAPDFLSVLKTVEAGYRAVTEPKATGTMTSVKSLKDEFGRKVRTLLRGMAALSYKRNLLNPFQYGIFAIELTSHKLMRWFVPFFLIISFITNLVLLKSLFYNLLFALQVLFYGLATLSMLQLCSINKKFIGRFPLYFVTVNAAILVAWYKYLVGTRQELWNPSNR